MNAEYTSNADKRVQFTVTPDSDGYPPPTTKLTERSTCGKYIYERLLVLENYDAQRDIAVYSLMGTGRRAV